MNLVETLTRIGLNEKQAQVYIALVQTGKATAYSVAKHSGLKKPTTYVILDELIAKGIVKKLPQAKTMHYTAISPEDLFSIYKSRIANAEKEALPELKALSRGKGYKVRATYYEGMEGIREMYKTFQKQIKKKKYVAFYAHERDASPVLLDFFKEMRDEFLKDNIYREGITVYDESIKRFLDPKYMKTRNIKLKALPIDKYNSNISIEIAGNLTQIFSHKHLQGIILDNPDIAKVLKQIFKLLWNQDDLFVKPKEKNK